MKMELEKFTNTTIDQKNLNQWVRCQLLEVKLAKFVTSKNDENKVEFSTFELALFPTEIINIAYSPESSRTAKHFSWSGSIQ